jgi:hypothetical protein
MVVSNPPISDVAALPGVCTIHALSFPDDHEMDI